MITGEQVMSAHYRMLALNLLLSAVIMYLVMFSMIDGFADFENNINTLYMTLTMVAPMGTLMLATMGSMYPNRRLNLLLHVLFFIVFAASLAATRNQTFVGDRQFLRSMIPHHSGAVLMCREAPISDPEIVELCQRITKSQREEIDQMGRIMSRLDGGT
jgi:uncharacterized protein (DUF305 family)